MSDLAEQLAAHPRFEWRAGMVAKRVGFLGGFRVGQVSLEGLKRCPEQHYPDLDDPATHGVLWAMLCEACDPCGELPYHTPTLYPSGSLTLRHVEMCGLFHFDSVGKALLYVWGLQCSQSA